MTFDNVPWVVTMKKNDHYFPTSEWTKVKDGSAEDASGWKRVTYEQGKVVNGEGQEGVNGGAGDQDTFDGNDDDVGEV